MSLTKMQRKVLRHFANEWERYERKEGGSVTLRPQQVAGSLGVEREVVSRCVEAFLSYCYLRQRNLGFPDCQITPEGIEALKPWPVRHADDIVVVIVGAIIASLLIWLVKFLIWTLLSGFH